MTFETGVHITIGAYTFTRCHEVVIERSTAIVQDIARIKLPLTARIAENGKAGTTVETAKRFNPGDKVKIKLIYRNVYDKTEFNGYVRRINVGQPLEIVCEDAIYLLRRKNIKKSWQSVTLKQVVNEIVKDTGIPVADSIPDIRLSPFGLNDVDGAFALQKLADEYGLRAYIQPDGALFCGLAYTQKADVVKYNINGKNSNVVSASDLKWRSRDDVKIKVKAVSIDKNNTRTEIEIGDEGGAIRTLNFYNIKNQAELTKIAKQKLDELKFDGYEGKITTLLIPQCEPGYKAQLTDSLFNERSGTYYVESVKTTYGTSGTRREVELGIKM